MLLLGARGTSARCTLRCVAASTYAAASLKNYSDSGKVREENICGRARINEGIG